MSSLWHCFSQKVLLCSSNTNLATLFNCFRQKSKKCQLKIKNWLKRLWNFPKIGFLQKNVPMERTMQFWQPSREFVTKSPKSLLKVRSLFEKKNSLKKHNFPPNHQLDTEGSHDNTLVFFPLKLWMNAAVGAGTIIKTISFSFNLVSSKCVLDVKIAFLSTLLFFHQKPEKF